MHCVDRRSRRSLQRGSDQTSKSESKTHTVRMPSIRSKIGRQEWAKAGLHVGEKKVQPFERAQTPVLSLQGIAHRISFRLAYFISSFLHRDSRAMRLGEPCSSFRSSCQSVTVARDRARPSPTQAVDLSTRSWSKSERRAGQPERAGKDLVAESASRRAIQEFVHPLVAKEQVFPLTANGMTFVRSDQLRSDTKRTASK